MSLRTGIKTEISVVYHVLLDSSLRARSQRMNTRWCKADPRDVSDTHCESAMSTRPISPFARACSASLKAREPCELNGKIIPVTLTLPDPNEVSCSGAAASDPTVQLLSSPSMVAAGTLGCAVTGTVMPERSAGVRRCERCDGRAATASIWGGRAIVSRIIP